MTVIRREAVSLCFRGSAGVPGAAQITREFLFPYSLGGWRRGSMVMSKIEGLIE